MNYLQILTARRCTMASALRNMDKRGGVAPKKGGQLLFRSIATTTPTTVAPGRSPTSPMPRALPTTKGTATTQTSFHQHHNLSTRRSPLPPMPRVLASPSTTADTNSSHAAVVVHSRMGGRLREWWDNGNVLLILGWTGLAVFALDRLLQYQQRADARDIVESIVYDSKLQKRALLLKWKDQPALFNCIIRREYKQMGGSYGLHDVMVGDVVEVLEEGIGPDKHYNLCRIQKDDGSGGKEDQIGWFPMSFMEKMEQKKPNKSLWRRILRRD